MVRERKGRGVQGARSLASTTKFLYYGLCACSGHNASSHASPHAPIAALRLTTSTSSRARETAASIRGARYHPASPAHALIAALIAVPLTWPSPSSSRRLNISKSLNAYQSFGFIMSFSVS